MIELLSNIFLKLFVVILDFLLNLTQDQWTWILSAIALVILYWVYKRVEREETNR